MKHSKSITRNKQKRRSRRNQRLVKRTRRPCRSSTSKFKHVKSRRPCRGGDLDFNLDSIKSQGNAMYSRMRKFMLKLKCYSQYETPEKSDVLSKGTYVGTDDKTLIFYSEDKLFKYTWNKKENTIFAPHIGPSFKYSYDRYRFNDKTNTLMLFKKAHLFPMKIFNNIQFVIPAARNWPTLCKVCDIRSTSEKCKQYLANAKENPFYLSDEISGYTNNGFYDGWGSSAPTNVEYIEVFNNLDIVNAVKYGISNEKKIIVKNTGHDYIGRSFPTDNMLVIITHNMDAVEWHTNEYIIDNNGVERTLQKIIDYNKHCDKDIEQEKGYCKVSAGAQWWKVFDYMLKHDHAGSYNRLDVWAMKGASNTVGAAGGWIMDGGFSSFTKLFGMGVDNVISMTVVLADGNTYDISNCYNEDLFFAFRGGGACNFGIVSSVTYRLLDALTSYGDFFILIPIENEDHFKTIFAIILQSGLVTNKHFSGTLQIFKNHIDIFLNYGNIQFEEVLENFVNPFIKKLNNNTESVNITLTLNIDESISTSDLFFGNDNINAILSKQYNTTIHPDKKMFAPDGIRWWEYESFNDYIIAFGSRYLLHTDIDNTEKCSSLFWEMLQHANMVQLETSKGLYGADEHIIKLNQSSSVHPKVREAIGLIYIRSYLKDFNPMIKQPYSDLKTVSFKYEDTASIFPDWEIKISDFDSIGDENEKRERLHSYIMEGVTKSSKKTLTAINILRNNFGDNSTYINHSDVNEPSWGEVFWGSNFEKLKSIKQKYDPNDVFCHRYSIPTTPTV